MKQRIGIVGGGQLGRMMTMAAKQLGFSVAILDPTPNSPAGQVADAQLVGYVTEPKSIIELARQVDYLTFEIESADALTLDALVRKGIVVNPSPSTLTTIKDKYRQKMYLSKLGLPVPAFTAVTSKADVEKAIESFGYPVILKARFDGYDGRGNVLIHREKDIDSAYESLKGKEVYLEQFVHFEKELAIMMARSIHGVIAEYPLVETLQKHHICHSVTAPAPVSDLIHKRAGRYAQKIMQHLHGAGVFGIEFFLTKRDELLINEIAPRVHNSGHYTIEACKTSQFEQHIRAITGLPLGSTEMVVPAAVMVNIIGERDGDVKLSGLGNALTIDDVSIHIYGKSETRKERKMGHITAVGKTHAVAYRKARRSRSLITI